jgi:uncharacterized membrane protein YesL
MMKGITNRLYGLAEWISHLAYLNFLWFIFCLFGLVVFGFMPATVTVFIILRKRLRHQGDLPVFKTFLKTYKEEFIKSHLVGIPLVILYAFIFIDLIYLRSVAGTGPMFIPIYFILLGTVLTTLYVFPVYAHYDLKALTVLKNAFLMMLIHPLNNLFMVIILVITFFVMKNLPALVVFFGVSFPALVIMASCYVAFQKLEKGRKRENDNARHLPE